jgi:hypothetical protein
MTVQIAFDTRGSHCATSEIDGVLSLEPRHGIYRNHPGYWYKLCLGGVHVP